MNVKLSWAGWTGSNIYAPPLTVRGTLLTAWKKGCAIVAPVPRPELPLLVSSAPQPATFDRAPGVQNMSAPRTEGGMASSAELSPVIALAVLLVACVPACSYAVRYMTYARRANAYSLDDISRAFAADPT